MMLIKTRHSQVIIRFLTTSNLKQIWMSLPVTTQRVDPLQEAAKITREVRALHHTNPSSWTMGILTKESQVWREQTTTCLMGRWQLLKFKMAIQTDLTRQLRKLQHSNSNETVRCHIVTTARPVKVATSQTLVTNSSGARPSINTAFKMELLTLHNKRPCQHLPRRVKLQKIAATDLDKVCLRTSTQINKRTSSA